MDQLLDLQTKSFAYADDLCVTSQQPTFSAVEACLTNALNGLHQYNAENPLKANPAKTQVCSFHQRTETLTVLSTSCGMDRSWKTASTQNILVLPLIARLHSNYIFRSARPKWICETTSSVSSPPRNGEQIPTLWERLHLPYVILQLNMLVQHGLGPVMLNTSTLH